MQDKPRKLQDRTVYVISGPESHIRFDDPQWIRAMDRRVRELERAEKEKRSGKMPRS